MDEESARFLELPVFTEPQREPEPMAYENAGRAFEEVIAAHRLREKPRAAEVIPEFRMD
ncbi:MAG: hypothetical protein SFU53_10000 [Terrimicrobiaceae bacterium]|nr:hypothetical protein [Terrimicrobiaceae bacterium]